ncbi:hypothetical protein OAN12_08715 [Halioglobus sp.]|nr:hypothetical protein [Halioglobus sp.]
MGLFDGFKKKNNDPKIESLVIGFLRTDAANNFKLDVNSAKFDKACEAAQSDIEKEMLPNLDKKIQQKVYDTLSRACPNRVDEAFGSYLIALLSRVVVIQKAIEAGEVSREEATFDVLQNALHDQVRQLLSSR